MPAASAQLMRLGWIRPVHCKSAEAKEVRALLTARKLVQSKLFDVEMSLRSILRGFGMTPKRFADRIKALVTGHATLYITSSCRRHRSSHSTQKPLAACFSNSRTPFSLNPGQ
jgi:transposase